MLYRLHHPYFDLILSIQVDYRGCKKRKNKMEYLIYIFAFFHVPIGIILNLCLACNYKQHIQKLEISAEWKMKL